MSRCHSFSLSEKGVSGLIVRNRFVSLYSKGTRIASSGAEKFMLLEMHAHTREHSSCSRIGAEALVKAVIAKGLDGLLLTDHHYQWSGEEVEELRRAAGAPASFLLASGQEVTTSDAGDILVYGAEDSIGPGMRLPELRCACPDAALVWAHPWRGPRRPNIAELFSPDIDAVEVLNRNHGLLRNRRALREWFALEFTAIGGTDVHGRIVGTYPTIFENEVRTVADVVKAIRAGRCCPSLKSRNSRTDDLQDELD